MELLLRQPRQRLVPCVHELGFDQVARWGQDQLQGSERATLKVFEGAWCLTTPSDCPAQSGSPLGAGSFGGLSGSVYATADGGYGIYVAPGTSHAYQARRLQRVPDDAAGHRPQHEGRAQDVRDLRSAARRSIHPEQSRAAAPAAVRPFPGYAFCPGSGASGSAASGFSASSFAASSFAARPPLRAMGSVGGKARLHFLVLAGLRQAWHPHRLALALLNPARGTHGHRLGIDSHVPQVEEEEGGEHGCHRNAEDRPGMPASLLPTMTEPRTTTGWSPPPRPSAAAGSRSSARTSR